MKNGRHVAFQTNTYCNVIKSAPSAHTICPCLLPTQSILPPLPPQLRPYQFNKENSCWPDQYFKRIFTEEDGNKGVFWHAINICREENSEPSPYEGWAGLCVSAR